MTSTHLLTITAVAYLLSAALYIAAFVSGASKLAKAATAVTVIALLLNTAGIGWRWQEYHQIGISYFSLTTMYESLVFFSWAVAIFALGLEKVYKNRTLAAFVMPFACASIAFASLSSRIPHEVKPLVPAFQNNWLTVHVAANFISYAAFAVACGMGAMRLLKSWHDARGREKPAGDPLAALPALTIIDRIVLQALVFGVLLYSGATYAGSMWAHSAWGAYWSWDPLEIWSLIVLLFYFVVLLIRLIKGSGGWLQSCAYMIGFAMIYFGHFHLLSFLRSLCN